MLIPFKELFPRWGIKPDGIVHLGANTGQEAEDYAELGIKRVIWVEAIPEVFRELVRNVAGRKGHLPLMACVGDQDFNPVKFHVSNNAAQSSSFLELGTHKLVHPEVKYVRDIQMTTIRLDTLFARKGISLAGRWLLNVDLQGAELLAIKGAGALMKSFDWLYLEVNEKPLYVNCPLVGELDSYLGRDFRRVETKMTGAGWGDALYVRKTS